MIVVQRENYSLTCTEIARVGSWAELALLLEEKKKEFEGKGWQVCWDNEEVKSSLAVWNGREGYWFGVYMKKVPVRKREFIW